MVLTLESLMQKTTSQLKIIPCPRRYTSLPEKIYLLCPRRYTYFAREVYLLRNSSSTDDFDFLYFTDLDRFYFTDYLLVYYFTSLTLECFPKTLYNVVQMLLNQYTGAKIVVFSAPAKQSMKNTAEEALRLEAQSLH